MLNLHLRLLSRGVAWRLKVAVTPRPGDWRQRWRELPHLPGEQACCNGNRRALSAVVPSWS